MRTRRMRAILPDGVRRTTRTLNINFSRSSAYQAALIVGDSFSGRAGSGVRRGADPGNDTTIT